MSPSSKIASTPGSSSGPVSPNAEMLALSEACGPAPPALAARKCQGQRADDQAVLCAVPQAAQRCDIRLAECPAVEYFAECFVWPEPCQSFPASQRHQRRRLTRGRRLLADLPAAVR